MSQKFDRNRLSRAARRPNVGSGVGRAHFHARAPSAIIMAFKDGITWASMWDEDGYLTEDGKLVAAGVYMLVAMIVLRFVREALIRAYPSNVHKFIPYILNAKNKRNDVVCVDCTHPALPTLTHHKDSRTTPSHLRGDTSTDTVLNALTKTGGWEPMRVASKVTCNHVRAPHPPRRVGGEIFLYSFFSAPDDARPNPAPDPHAPPPPPPERSLTSTAHSPCGPS